LFLSTSFAVFYVDVLVEVSASKAHLVRQRWKAKCVFWVWLWREWFV